jgi:hypothetical protein
MKSQVNDYIPPVSSAFILFKQKVTGNSEELQDDANIGVLPRGE